MVPALFPFPTMFLKGFLQRVVESSLRLAKCEPFPKQALVFTCSRCLLKTPWENEKLLVTSNFSFSHSVFYPFREPSAIFIKFKFVACKHLSVWKSLKFGFWEGVKGGRSKGFTF